MTKRRRQLSVLVLSCLALVGCGTTRWTDTKRTATEQMLISDAVDRAVSQMNFSLLAGQFAQIALAQYPTILFYFPALIILYKLKDYDTSNPETNDNSKQPA